MFDCKTLASGSTGNCVFFREGKSAFLIDAGISFKKICSYLSDMSLSLDALKGVFITHEHSDHTKALATLSKRTDIPIYATLPTAREIYQALFLKNDGEACRRFKENVRIIETGICYPAGELGITAFDLPHDSVSCVGFCISDDFGEKLLGLAADMGHITSKAVEALVGCKSVILESNHDLEMLKNSSYPSFLKERIGSDYGHLSNFDCSRLAEYLIKNNTKNLCLYHLSEENNLPELALSTTSERLAASTNTAYNVTVAAKEGITEVIQ